MFWEHNNPDPSQTLPRHRFIGVSTVLWKLVMTFQNKYIFFSKSKFSSWTLKKWTISISCQNDLEIQEREL